MSRFRVPDGARGRHGLRRSASAAKADLGREQALFDAFFVAIIAGLVVATILTRIVVPALYAIAFDARST